MPPSSKEVRAKAEGERKLGNSTSDNTKKASRRARLAQLSKSLSAPASINLADTNVRWGLTWAESECDASKLVSA